MTSFDVLIIKKLQTLSRQGKAVINCTYSCQIQWHELSCCWNGRAVLLVPLSITHFISHRSKLSCRFSLWSGVPLFNALFVSSRPVWEYPRTSYISEN